MGFVQSCSFTVRLGSICGAGRLETQFEELTAMTTPAASAAATPPLAFTWSPTPLLTTLVPGAGGAGASDVPAFREMSLCAQPMTRSTAAKAIRFMERIVSLTPNYRQARRRRSSTAAHCGASGGASMRITSPPAPSRSLSAA